MLVTYLGCAASGARGGIILQLLYFGFFFADRQTDGHQTVISIVIIKVLVGCARVASQNWLRQQQVLAEASSSNCFILGIFLRTDRQTDRQTDRHQTVITIVIMEDWELFFKFFWSQNRECFFLGTLHT
jgi:hypothetical protein